MTSENKRYEGKIDPLRDMRATPRSLREAFGNPLQPASRGLMPWWVYIMVIILLMLAVCNCTIFFEYIKAL